jgi:hypothetical protein
MFNLDMCGIIIMIAFLLLLWYFIKTNTFTCHEGMEDQSISFPMSIRFDQEIENTSIESDNAISDILNGNDSKHLEFKYTDQNYPLLKGMYSDVPVYLNADIDRPHIKKWRHNSGIYIPNSLRYWEASNKT